MVLGDFVWLSCGLVLYSNVFFIFLVLWEEKEVTVAKKVHREFLCFKVVKNVKIYLSILMKICVKCKGCNVFQRMDL